VNFFDPQCQTGPFNDALFGLCDDQSSTTAYVDLTAQENWLATVENPNERDVIFTAIDKCVIKDDEAAGVKRCDCMLTTHQELYLIELKDWSRGGWQARSIEQLKCTIELLEASHTEEVLNRYRPKKAYICNNRKSPFPRTDFNTKNHFYRSYRFRLYIQTIVKIP
jgi:hypothetical protein